MPASPTPTTDRAGPVLATAGLTDDELRFRAGLLDAVEQSVVVTDLNGTIIYWNRLAETFYGWSRAEALGQNVGKLLVSDSSEADGRQILARLRQGHSWSGECALRRRDGTRFPGLLTNSPLRDPAGRIVGVIGVSTDISARKRAEEVQARLAAIVTSSEDAIIATTLDGTITDWNRGAEMIYGYTAAEMVGRRVSALIPDDRESEAPEFVTRMICGEQIEQFETVRLHKDGHRLDMSISITPIRASDGAVIGSAGISRDISMRKKADAALAHQVLHDALTGLPNRRLLHTRLRQSLAAHSASSPLALLLLDLDRFKEVNDTLGHQVGDVLLQEIGQRLHAAVRAADLVARLGGDEFAILLPGTDSAGAAKLAEVLVGVLQAPFVLEGQPVSVAASIGIAVAPEHGLDADTLLRCADVAMYAAKRSGTGAALYCAADDQNRSDRLALLGELRRAIDNDELVLHYQPKLDLKDGVLVGVEALVRWQHPQRGFLPPSEFIQLAEDSGLIGPLTRWVLNAALRQHETWRSLGMDVPVAVNLSRRTLHDRLLPEMVAQSLADSAAAPTSLVLEITESSLMADPGRAAESLSQLRALGVRISIDDFGTGYSSLASLKNLPVDELKIDQSFVQAMATDASSRAIVRAIIDLADALNLRVVAEGVEDRATWDVLAGLGCEVAQGYFLSRPIAAVELQAWVRDLGPSWLAMSDRPGLEEALQERIRGRGARLTAEEEFIARKRAEAALRDSEERNRLALQAAGMGTWDFVVASNVHTWSVETEVLFGFAPGSFKGTQAAVKGAIHPDDWPAFQAEDRAAQAERRDSLCTYRTLWPDGSVHWLEEKGRRQYGADGTLVRITGTTMDITERRLAEEALRAAAERFRLQYKRVPLPTYSWLLVGDDFVLHDFNDAAEAVSGGRIRESLGGSAKDHQPRILASLRRCFAERRTLREDLDDVDTITGRARQLAATYVFVAPRTVMVCTEDVTEARPLRA